MASIYFFKYTTEHPFAEDGIIQYAGIIAADSYTDAMNQIEKQETAGNGKCDLIKVDYLEENDDALLFTDNLELFQKVYEDMI